MSLDFYVYSQVSGAVRQRKQCGAEILVALLGLADDLVPNASVFQISDARHVFRKL